MNDVTREWLLKAEGDLLTAQRELAVGDRPNFDAACFHAQQAVEKLMKAVLIACGEMPPRAHDLVVLNDLVARHLPGWIWPIEALRFLSRAAVAFRYPGESAERQDADEAVAIASALCQALRGRLTELAGN